MGDWKIFGVHPCPGTECGHGPRSLPHGHARALDTQSRVRFAIAGKATPGHQQKRFTAAECRDRLRVVASPDARGGSLRINQDALIHSALLEPGQHVVHELSHGRSAWIHVVQGEVTLGDIVLAAGDGAGVTGERAVSLTAREDSEILLVDLGGGSSPATSAASG